MVLTWYEHVLAVYKHGVTLFRTPGLFQQVSCTQQSTLATPASTDGA